MPSPAPTVDQSRSYGAGIASLYDDIFPAGEATSEVVRSIASRIPRSPSAPTAVIVEQGAGTGRIAVPLAQHGFHVLAVDSSPELLDILRERIGDVPGVIPIEADIREFDDVKDADAVICVCGTISMLLSDEEQRAALACAARMLRPGGVVIVETHDPTFVRHICAEGMGTWTQACGAGDVVMDAQLLREPRLWQLRSTYRGPDGSREMTEASRLTTPDQLIALASDLGLRPRSASTGWSGEYHAGSGPMFVVELVKQEPQRTPQRS